MRGTLKVRGAISRQAKRWANTIALVAAAMGLADGLDRPVAAQETAQQVPQQAAPSPGVTSPVLSASPAETARAYEQMVEKAVGYLRTSGQLSDGSYASPIGPGVTSLVTTALLRHGRSPDDPMVARSLKYHESFVQ